VLRDRIVASAGVLAILFSVAGCVKPKQTDAKDELESFAAKTGGKWIEKIGSLQGSNPAILNQLELLTGGASSKIRMLIISQARVEVAPRLDFLSSLKYLQLSFNSLIDVSNLAGLQVAYLDLSNNPDLKEIQALRTCTEMEELFLNSTDVEQLPNFSSLNKLRKISVNSTPLRSLSNIETIPTDFDLSIMRCNRLADISALLLARVNTLYIDEKNYERLKPWFDAHTAEIRAKRQKFKLQFQVISGE
jgi:hypothetical protein